MKQGRREDFGPIGRLQTGTATTIQQGGGACKRFKGTFLDRDRRCGRDQAGGTKNGICLQAKNADKKKPASFAACGLNPILGGDWRRQKHYIAAQHILIIYFKNIRHSQYKLLKLVPPIDPNQVNGTQLQQSTLQIFIQSETVQRRKSQTAWFCVKSTACICKLT